MEEYAVILAESTSHAIKGEKVLRDAGIKAKLIPLPRHLSSDCGVSVRIPVDKIEDVESILKEKGVPFIGIEKI
jgi:Putative Se/S carrier protein-like